VSAVVLNRQGRVVPYVEVGFRDRETRRISVQRAGEDGRISVDGLDGVEYECYLLYVDPRGGLRSGTSGFVIAGDDARSGRLPRFPFGGSLGVVVVDGDGAAAQRASIWVDREDCDWGWSFCRSGGGVACLGTLPDEGRLRLAALSDDGFALRDVDLDARPAIVEIQPVAATVSRLAIVDSSGAKVRGAFATTEPRNIVHRWGRGQLDNRDTIWTELFLRESADEASYDLHWYDGQLDELFVLSALGGARLGREDARRAAQEERIVVATAGFLHGTVVDAEAGDPVERCEVRGVLESGDAVRAITDQRGTFCLYRFGAFTKVEFSIEKRKRELAGDVEIPSSGLRVELRRTTPVLVASSLRASRATPSAPPCFEREEP